MAEWFCETHLLEKAREQLARISGRTMVFSDGHLTSARGIVPALPEPGGAGAGMIYVVRRPGTLALDAVTVYLPVTWVAWQVLPRASMWVGLCNLWWSSFGSYGVGWSHRRPFLLDSPGKTGA